MLVKEVFPIEIADGRLQAFKSKDEVGWKSMIESFERVLGELSMGELVMLIYWQRAPANVEHSQAYESLQELRKQHVILRREVVDYNTEQKYTVLQLLVNILLQEAQAIEASAPETQNSIAPKKIAS